MYVNILHNQLPLLLEDIL